MRRLVVAIAAVVAAAAATVFMALPNASAATPVRIMPLGDSITGNPGCWRALLWQALQNGGYTNIDFVGTQPPQGCGIAYDGDGEGHGGALVTDVANQNLLPGWLSATHPDIVLMHFGTNDVWSNRSTDTILAAYSKLVDQMRASNPAMRVLVAQIIPVDPPSCPECAARTVALNNAIPGWAAGKTTAASPITVVDQWTGWVSATDTGDGVHPNDSGIRKMADKWYPPLTRALGGVQPSPSGSTTPNTSPSPSKSTSPSPSASASASNGTAACTATYKVVGQWPGGFQGEVTVRNSGSKAITAWTTRFTFTAGEQVQQSWGTTLTQSGATVTAVNAPWNGALAPGATASYGFIGSGTSGTPGVICTGS
ncbi:cellulose binding domain-containing protein [Dactylosporangium sp. AC04546]|uniref:cellulose binding domain-containing protein n=1 Tax=Dactylosporangium sp. AC04546 TaxID=2862460 RepID=UPI001EDF19AB|nr:cellulose binding domain-containing protein [Dactylosporangium sp. AC04546]WVK87511.1 cellulose binding domain-containing protein [Dactylosporangium sp. AC04546]